IMQRIASDGRKWLTQPVPQRLAFNTKSLTRKVQLLLDDIAYFYAYEGVACVVFKHGGSLVIAHKLTEIERRLPPHFVRIHKSFVANMQEVQSYTKAKEPYIEFNPQNVSFLQ